MASTATHLRSSFLKLWPDALVRTIIFIVIFISVLLLFISTLLGVVILLFFVSGLVVTSVLVEEQNKAHIKSLIQKAKNFFGYREFKTAAVNECDVCGSLQCSRHQPEVAKNPWRRLLIDKSLDNAVEKFFSQILNNFINSWFSQLSNDKLFMHLLKYHLRDATCRLVLRFKQLNTPVVITDKLLPCIFDHYEIVTKMLQNGVTMDKLASKFLLNDHPIHPAVCNRAAEIRYLRTIAKHLIPKLLQSDCHDSKVFLSLIRELLSCWVLLPLLDVISDPNLLNLLVIVATNPPSHKYDPKETEKVMFLGHFVDDLHQLEENENAENLLSDQTKLYSFMQFLKREGAVDILRFHLDVESLNVELLDPRVTTDPAKLSALYQQSESLLKHYVALSEKDLDLPSVDLLNEAHEAIKSSLYGKWTRSYVRTPEYLNLIYGEKAACDQMIDFKLEGNHVSSSKFAKLKTVIRGAAVDGAPIEATEMPTMWGDALGDHALMHAANSSVNSVPPKLRKAENLDGFMSIFMASIEQTMDVGEDVIRLSDPSARLKGLEPPGKSLVFGNLFELRKPPNSFAALKYGQNPVKGPPACLVYIMSKVLKLPDCLSKVVLALINIARQTVESIICSLIQMLINVGLFEPRLAILITLLEEQLFEDDFKPDPTPSELLDRQKVAKQRLSSINKNLGIVMDCLQSPPLNKHLIYTLFDLILVEIYPEIEKLTKEEFHFS